MNKESEGRILLFYLGENKNTALKEPADLSQKANSRAQSAVFNSSYKETHLLTTSHLRFSQVFNSIIRSLFMNLVVIMNILMTKLQIKVWNP